MKLLIGLGNPGNKFEKNRHNVGHMFVDFAKQGIKTAVFMNDSGTFVKQELRNSGIKELSDLYVVHDDLDLALGNYKIQLGTGPKDHKGIASIEQELGIKEFWRIRIGVDARDSNNRIPGEEYVLQDFNKEELAILKGVFDAIAKDDSFPS